MNPGGVTPTMVTPLRADLNRLPQHRRTGSEATCPQGMADDRDIAVAAAGVPIVGRRQHPPVGRVNAENVEVTAGGELPPQLLLHAVDRHFEPAGIEAGDAGQVTVVIVENFVARVRRAAAAPGLAAGVVDEEELLRVRDSQGSQKYRVDQAEDGGVRADAESQREDGDDGEGRRAAQQPQCIAEVGAKLVEQAQAERLAAFLRPGADTAELGAGAAARLRRRHPGPHEILRVAVEMELELVADRSIEIRAVSAGVQPRTKARENPHSSSAAVLSTPSMMSAMRFQLRACSWSRRRPAAVSE